MERGTESKPQKKYDLKGKRIFVAGSRGMVGAALVRRLQKEDCEVLTSSHATLDLTSQDAVHKFFQKHKPHAVLMAAARVGGILANATFPAEFLYDNLMIAANVTEAAFQNKVEKLLFLGSSCIYPRLASQPMEESALLTGPLEPTNQWYAIAKIAGLKLAEAYRRQYGCDYISAMPTNLYGPGDNYDLESSHVLPALLRKAHDAKVKNTPQLTVWGTGTPQREFLHVTDCADALVHVLKVYSDEAPINVGSGQEYSIGALAQMIADVVGYKGRLQFDISKPDGTPRKLMNCEKLRGLGWQPKISLKEGLVETYKDFCALPLST